MTIRNFIKVLPLLAGAVALSSMFVDGAESQNIQGSAHDFSAQSWYGKNEICIVCHTPHNAAPDNNNLTVPLWNRQLNGTTTASYSVYSDGNSATLDSTQQQIGTSQRISRACLSCHDGTVNIDAYGSNSGTTTITAYNVNTTANLGTDLRTSHPVAFTYDTALVGLDPELFDPTTTTSGLGANIDGDLLFGSGNDQLECASCHDVHDDAIPYFLRKTQEDSALCLTCHNK